MWVEFVVGSLLRFSLLFKNQHLEIPILRVPNGGGGGGGGAGRGGPWSPGALKFLLWSLEPKDILRGARSPAFSSRADKGWAVKRARPSKKV